MLDDIIEIILDIILEGMTEAAGSKKVPVPIRIALGAILAMFVIVLFVLFLIAGISNGSTVLIVLSIVLMAALVIWVAFKVGSFQKHNRSEGSL